MRTNVYKQQILKLLKQRHLLGLSDICQHLPEADYSTIFRNIKKLCDEKLIKKVIVNDKTVLYELAQRHHDHFVCDDCGGVESVNLKLEESVSSRLQIRDIVVHGSCGKCQSV